MKKKGLMGLLAVGLLVGLLLPASVAVVADPDPGLVGYWTFDEASGATAFDYSSIGNDGTLQGEAGRETGVFGSALSLDGVEDYVSVPDDDSLDVEAITIAAWVKADVAITNTTQMQVVDKGEHLGGSGYMLMIYDGKLYGRVNKAGGTACIDTDNFPDDGEWHHVAYTCSDGDQNLYLDGVVQISTSASATIVSNSQSLLIGRGVNRPQYCWDGAIDEVGVWDEALSETDIAAICANGIWAFEADVQIEKSADVVGSDNDAVAHEGDQIDYSYTVTNTGSVPLFDVNVTDSPLGAVTLSSGLTDEDGDASSDDLAIGGVATGTLSHTVDTVKIGGSDADPLVNTATVTASYAGEDVTDDSEEVEVDILHPAIGLEKVGPDWQGYFESVEAEYTYIVTNEGDCTLYAVALEDYPLGTLTSPEGDDNSNGFLDEGEEWKYEIEEVDLICEGDDMTEFPNFAVVTAEDELGAEVMDCDCWNVLVFQWQPRTIGYWGNWDNHMTSADITGLVRWVNIQSDYFGGCADPLTVPDVESILGEPAKKGKMDEEKAEMLLMKQLIATWLNVKSFEGLHDDNALTWGAADAAINPDATVYVDGEADGTVRELLARIEYLLCRDTRDVKGMLVAKDLLDEMNNAEHENNYYSAFMESELDKSECRPCLVGEWEMDLYLGTTLYDRFVVIAGQSDGDVEGVMGIGYNPAGDPTGDVTGHVDCLSVYMFYDREGYANTGYTAEFWGTLAMDGNSASGTWSDYPRTCSQTWVMRRL